MVVGGGGDVFLLLARVLLEEGTSTAGLGASMASLGAKGLGLLAVECQLERVRVDGGGKLSRTMLPMGGRPPSLGTMSE